MPFLNDSASVVIYDDPTATSNPQFRYVDWRRQISNWSVNNPLNKQVVIPPGTSQVIFNGSRITTIDNTTTFSISLNPISSTTYRISYTSGTVPGFRTDRGLNLTGDTVTLAVNNNSTLTVTVVTNNFSSVLIGDQIWIPGVATGDASLNSPFNPLNVGLWTVIAKASGGTPKTITLTRLSGTAFSGTSETQSPTSAAQFVAFSSAGVQIGDTLNISSGFSPVTQSNGGYNVSNVTSTFVEFKTSLNLPLETGIQPGATGLVFYTVNKNFLKIETDQPAALRFNAQVGGGDTNCSVQPRVVGDPNSVSVFTKTGPCYALEIQNLSPTFPLTAIIISAE